MTQAENSMNPDWPPARIAELRIAWAAGKSAGIIAKELGVSRSAIVGKARRLELPARDRLAAIAKCAAERKAQGNMAGGTIASIKRRTRAQTRASTPKRPFGEDAGLTQRIKAKANGSSAPIEPIVWNKSLADFNAAIPAEQRKTIVDLTEQSCRWPLWGDDGGDRFYCGAPEADMTEGRPYCRVHAAHAGAGYSRERGNGFQRSVNNFR